MRSHFTLFFTLFLTVTFLIPIPLMGQANVHILTTGGTIASVNGAPMIDGPQLVQAVPQLLDYADIRVEEFSKIGSSKMKPANWLQLARRINELIREKPEIASIIITHGTDSMEETAFFLNLTVKTDIPVIIVGSMRSSNEISADGPANLLNAVRVGISPEAKGKGVLAVLNENISAGRDLLKINNRRVETFKAHELGYLGFADPDTVIFYRAPLKPHTLNSDFDQRGIEQLPKVDIIQDFAGFDPKILELIGQRDIDGLVISSFAGGRMSYGMLEGLEKIAEKNIPIVIASSIKQGRIIGKPYREQGWIISPDLPANKARILLMLALTKTSDKSDIQEIFHTY